MIDENGENGNVNVAEEADSDLERLSGLSLPLGEWFFEGTLENGTLLTGVAYPDVKDLSFRRRASPDA